MPVRSKPQVPSRALRGRLGSCVRVGSTVMLPVTSPRPKYCTSTLPSFASATLLVRAVHRGAGVDRRSAGSSGRSGPRPGCSTSIFRIVGTVNRLVTRCRSISCEGLAASKRSDGSSTVWRAAGDCVAGGRRRRATAVPPPASHRPRCARHQVAQVVGDDEAHLAVGQHRGLRPARGAGGEEEPAGIVVLDRRGGRLAPLWARRSARRQAASPKPACPSSQMSRNVRHGLAHRRGMLGEVGLAQQERGCAEPRPCRRPRPGSQPEVGRHPDRAEAEGGEHRLEHLVAVLATARARGRPWLHAQPAAPRPGRRRARRARAQVQAGRPRPGRCVREAAGVCGSGSAQVHHPPGTGELLGWLISRAPGWRRSWRPRRRPC